MGKLNNHTLKLTHDDKIVIVSLLKNGEVNLNKGHIDVTLEALWSVVRVLEHKENNEIILETKQGDDYVPEFKLTLTKL